MKNLKLRISLLCGLSILSAIHSIKLVAQWNTIPTPNNEVIGTGVANSNQTAPDITAHNTVANTYAICWQDRRTASTGFDIYAQNYDVSGFVQWGANGTLICNAANQQTAPRIVASTNGSDFYIAWEDQRNGNFDIYLQRVNQSGIAQWVANGLPVVTSCGNQKSLEMIPTSNGGVIITWVDERNGDPDVFAQHFNTAGVAQWKQNGVPVCTEVNTQNKLQIATDGFGGAFIVWEDLRSGAWASDIFGQRINSSGRTLWANNGIQICTFNSSKTSPQIVRSPSSATTNFFVSWIDNRTAQDPYYSLMNINGIPITSANGSPAYIGTTIGANTTEINMISDRNAGVYIAWDDISNGNQDVYAQRIDVSGNISSSWPLAGSQLCNDLSVQRRPKMATCDDELIVTFLDYRSGSNPSVDIDLYYQSVNTANGAINGTLTAFPLATSTNAQVNHRVTIMHGNVVAAWEDRRRIPVDGNDIYCSPIPVTCTSYPTTSQKTANTNNVNQVNLVDEEFVIYPNPSSNEIKIKHSTLSILSKLEIYSVDGKLVASYDDYNCDNSLDVSRLAPGEYLIKVLNSKSSLKFLKK